MKEKAVELFPIFEENVLKNLGKLGTWGENGTYPRDKGSFSFDGVNQPYTQTFGLGFMSPERATMLTDHAKEAGITLRVGKGSVKNATYLRMIVDEGLTADKLNTLGDLLKEEVAKDLARVFEQQILKPMGRLGAWGDHDSYQKSGGKTFGGTYSV